MFRRASQAKVHQPGFTRRIDHHVTRFDVAVEDPFGMDRLHGPSKFQHQIGSLRRENRATSHPSRKRQSVDQGHCQVIDTANLTCVEDRANVWMADGCRRAASRTNRSNTDGEDAKSL